MFSINKKRSSQVGSTLIEVLVAVTIIAMALTSIGSMIAMSIRLSNSNEQKQLALQKAQEAIEFFRKERLINSWYSFSTNLGDGDIYCMDSLPTSVASMSAMLGACGSGDYLEAAKYNFFREAEITFASANSLTVKVDIDWEDSGKAKNLEIEQSFENY